MYIGRSSEGEISGVILDASFTEVKVESESIFPLDLALSDPTVAAAKDALEISDIEAGEIARSILSVSVSAEKPVMR